MTWATVAVLSVFMWMSSDVIRMTANESSVGYRNPPPSSAEYSDQAGTSATN